MTEALRGEVWTAAGTGYVSKPRPVVVIQDDVFRQADSVTVMPFTTDPVDAPILRIPVEPSPDNGLDAPSKLMVDKVATIRRTALGMRLGSLEDEHLVEVKRALAMFLGLTG